MSRTIADFPRIPPEEVQNAFEYHPDSGLLIRTRKDGYKKAAGTQTANGEIRVYWKGTIWPAHLLVWLHQVGSWPASMPVHLNKDRSNNAMTNLRMRSTMEAEAEERERAAREFQLRALRAQGRDGNPVPTMKGGNVLAVLAEKARQGHTGT
jgi:hypothetical protein